MAANQANSPISCEKGNESVESDTLQQQNFIPLGGGDTLIESNSSWGMMEKNTFKLEPVSPFTSGKGLPYAPEGWPNPGDIWGWSVGRRTNSAGYYTDRYLYPPRSLFKKQAGKKRHFQSKPDVERCIKSNFPNIELGAFFALFSWKVPSTALLTSEAEKSFSISPRPLNSVKVAANEIVIKGKQKRKAKGRNLANRKSLRLGNVRPYFPSVVQDANDIIDLSTKDLTGPLDSELDQPENSFLAVSNLVDFKEGSSMQIAPEQYPNVTIAENFDDYLSTLEEIIVLPCTGIPPSDLVVSGTTLEDEMIECRSKLSSLLAMDLSTLAYADNLAEVAKLASQLRRDPSLSIDQLIKLKLVEEIPLLCEAFKEAKDNIEEADKFFAELEAKKLKVPSLKTEYSALKDKLSELQVEIDTSSSAIKEIDDQILQLQTKRLEMHSSLKTMNKTKLELACTQAMVANSIPTIVGEIQHGNSEKPEWELKKAKCVERVAEIQERFITLRGLTF